MEQCQIITAILGELIYEHKAKIMGNRVLDVEGPEMETSYSLSALLLFDNNASMKRNHLSLDP